MTERPDPAALAYSLRAVLDAVDAGEVEATAVERAYLAGGLDVAQRLAGDDEDDPGQKPAE